MKKINLIIISLLFSISCKAQILDAYNVDVLIGEVNGAYYKDVNNFRDQFVGTWVYSQGNTQLTIMIQKRDNLHVLTNFSDYYEDILIGEYRYVENGIEKINTLANINTNYGNDYKENWKHNLFGGLYLRRSTSYPRCNECAPNERRMEFSYSEPNYDGKGIANGHVVVRKFVENGVHKIKIWFYTSNQIVFVDSAGNPVDNPAPFKIPFGEYVLTKQ